MAADSGVETCSSPENADSRKRPLDTDVEDSSTKKSNCSSGNDEIYHFKILVPSVAAGAIIGKGGETIAQLQKDTNARIKMSKANDFYPGTSERVCLISGHIESIMEVLDFITFKIREKPEVNSKTGVEHDPKGGEREKQVCGEGGGKRSTILCGGQTVNSITTLVQSVIALDYWSKATAGPIVSFVRISESRNPCMTCKRSNISATDFLQEQVKILVPNSTAGMIIGKGGKYIKQLKDESGAYVQISQKAKDQSLQERCITVMGDVSNNKKACAMILSKVQEDPQSGSSLNVSYADITGPVANYNPTGSPYAQSSSQQQFTPASSIAASIPWAGLIESAGLTGITLTLNLEPNNSPSQAVVTQVINAITVALNNTGYADHIKAEISNAITTLGKYRMLGVTWTGTSPAPAYMGIQALDGTSNGFFGQLGGTTGRSVIDLALEPFRHTASGPNSPPHLNNNAFSLGNHEPSDPKKESRKVEIEIAEAIVGAILGHGGRSLIEIQQMSGALIQISKKGIYAPGTRNRIVSITGSPNSVNTAQYLIGTKIKDEELKRTRQSQILMLH